METDLLLTLTQIISLCIVEFRAIRLEGPTECGAAGIKRIFLAKWRHKNYVVHIRRDGKITL
jgi:hypothetical protein